MSVPLSNFRDEIDTHSSSGSGTSHLTQRTISRESSHGGNKTNDDDLQSSEEDADVSLLPDEDLKNRFLFKAGGLFPTKFSKTDYLYFAFAITLSPEFVTFYLILILSCSFRCVIQWNLSFIYANSLVFVFYPSNRGRISSY